MDLLKAVGIPLNLFAAVALVKAILVLNIVGFSGFLLFVGLLILAYYFGAETVVKTADYIEYRIKNFKK